jgi:DNA ligase (NAD+)
MGNNRARKKHAKELSVLVGNLDVAYRSGNAQVTDKQFDQLENRLREIEPQNSYFQKKMKLLSLDNYCFSEWWAKSAKGETMIVQPKFDGCALGLRYQSGTLVAAFTRSGKDVTEAARTICNLPLELPEDGIAVSEDPVEIRGELYGPNLSRTKSQALAAGHLRKKNPTGAGLSFVAYEILGSTANEIEDIKKLESWFFEIPPTNRTADPKQVKQWHKEWLAGELFENLPCDGLVVKVASGESKNRLGVNSKAPNWAIALKG